MDDDRDYLGGRIESGDIDIEVVSQLPAILRALRKNDYNTLQMEQFLKDNYHTLTPQDKVRLHTNIAAIKEYGDEFIYHLEQAINEEQSFPNPYIILGLHYMEEKEYTKSLPLLQKAWELSGDTTNHYNYAVALFKNGKIQEAREIFRELNKREPQNIRCV